MVRSLNVKKLLITKDPDKEERQCQAIVSLITANKFQSKKLKLMSSACTDITLGIALQGGGAERYRGMQDPLIELTEMATKMEQEICPLPTQLYSIGQVVVDNIASEFQ